MMSGQYQRSAFVQEKTAAVFNLLSVFHLALVLCAVWELIHTVSFHSWVL